MRLRRLLTLACLLLAASSRSAFADGTLFLGTVTTPANHATKGFAIGAGFLIVGVEFEYASTSEDAKHAAPSLKTGMGNFYLQTPIPIAGMQFYWTTGAGGYRRIASGNEYPFQHRWRREGRAGGSTEGAVRLPRPEAARIAALFHIAPALCRRESWVLEQFSNLRRGELTNWDLRIRKFVDS